MLLAVLAAPPVRLLPQRPRHALVRAWAAALVGALGIRITVHGSPGPDGGRLVVANHISWLDIPLVAAALPCRMLAKSEIGAWPVLGRLAAGAGTLFIERDRIRALPRTVDAVSRSLLAGDRVTVFPEGSTWCGRAQGPFRRAVFQAALDARVPVQPVRLAYRSGADGSLAGAPAFVGDDPLTASLWRIARARGIRAEVRLLPRIPPGRHPDRRDLAAAAQRAVCGDAGQPTLPGVAGSALQAVGHRQGQRETALRVRPPLRQLEPGRRQFAPYALLTELRGDLRQDLLTLLEGHHQIQCPDLHQRLRPGPQPHLDPLLFPVPHRHVFEVGRVEISAQLPVDHRQYVLVELRRHPLGVVVRGHQHRLVLHQVRTHQQRVTRRQHRPYGRQERGALRRPQVPDRAAQEHHQPRVGRLRQAQRPGEVRQQGVHPQPRMLSQQRLCRPRRALSLTSTGT